MTPNMERGARIIIHEWVKVRAWDKVLIVTSKEYLAEAKAMEKEASGKARSVNTLLVENKGRHVGIFFDDNEAVFDPLYGNYRGDRVFAGDNESRKACDTKTQEISVLATGNQ